MTSLAAPCVVSSDAAQAPRKRDARRHVVHVGHARYTLGDARGLEVSPGSLLQNEFVERQVRDCAPELDILSLELL